MGVDVGEFGEAGTDDLDLALGKSWSMLGELAIRKAADKWSCLGAHITTTPMFFTSPYTRRRSQASGSNTR
jgi:hypothetical protein